MYFSSRWLKNTKWLPLSRQQQKYIIMIMSLIIFNEGRTDVGQGLKYRKIWSTRKECIFIYIESLRVCYEIVKNEILLVLLLNALFRFL